MKKKNNRKIPKHFDLAITGVEIFSANEIIVSFNNNEIESRLVDLRKFDELKDLLTIDRKMLKNIEFSDYSIYWGDEFKYSISEDQAWIRGKPF